MRPVTKHKLMKTYQSGAGNNSRSIDPKVFADTNGVNERAATI